MKYLKFSKEVKSFKISFFLFFGLKSICLTNASKYGEYKFHGTYSVNAVLKKLKEGKSLNRKITIVEGSSKSDLLIFLKL